MKLDILECDLLIDAPAGTNVMDVAGLLLRTHRVWPMVTGFTFNGVNIRLAYDKDETVEQLVEKYTWGARENAKHT